MREHTRYFRVFCGRARKSWTRWRSEQDLNFQPRFSSARRQPIVASNGSIDAVEVAGVFSRNLARAEQKRPPADDVTRSLETTSDKIRALARAGYYRTEISKLLNIRYQHVRKVLVDAGIAGGDFRDGRGTLVGISGTAPMSASSIPLCK
jgi:hypothetical protein